MKILSLLMFVMFLASCTSTNVESEQKTMKDNTVSQETVAELTDAM
jgi:hypothetical protein